MRKGGRGSSAMRLFRLLGGMGQDVLPLRLTPEDESRFRQALRRNLIYARTGLFIALAIGFGLAPLYQGVVFRPEPGLVPTLVLIQCGIVLPLCVAATAVTILPAPRLLTQLTQTAAVFAALAAVIVFRYFALEGRQQYPSQMIGVVLIAIAVLNGFTWQRMGLAALLCIGAAIAVEYAMAGSNGTPTLEAYTLAIMGIIAALGAYNLETLARFTWWESSQLRRIRAELLQSERTVRLQSMTDELTGHYNRRGFTMLAAQELRHARRRQQRCALLFVDVDGLKGINARHGHDGGDQALVMVAEALRVAARNTDIVARLGGDEFVVFAVDCQDVEAIRGRMVQQIEHYNETAALPFPLSVSIGVSEVDAGGDVALETLIAQADRRMYEDKRERASA